MGKVISCVCMSLSFCVCALYKENSLSYQHQSQYVNVNVTDLSARKVLLLNFDGCTTSVVFSFLRNCSGSKDDDFTNEGREFQHIGPEMVNAREPNVTQVKM